MQRQRRGGSGAISVNRDKGEISSSFFIFDKRSTLQGLARSSARSPQSGGDRLSSHRESRQCLWSVVLSLTGSFPIFLYRRLSGIPFVKIGRKLAISLTTGFLDVHLHGGKIQSAFSPTPNTSAVLPCGAL